LFSRIFCVDTEGGQSSAINLGWIEMTNKENPKDRNQKYVLTGKGWKLMGLNVWHTPPV
jgi:hypothetical protein